MLFKKTNNQKNTKATENIIGSGLSYEQDRELMYKRSNRIAWTVAGVSVALIPILVFGGIVALNKIADEVTKPSIFGFDSSTGIVDSISVISKDSIAELGAQEALDKHFVNNYIHLRESYSYQTIQDTYEQTQLFSSDQVADDYRKEFNAPTALDRVLGTGTAKVKVISITLENIGGENIATVRAQVNTKDSKGVEDQKTYTIRLSYIYEPQSGLKISERMKNPMGFFVTSYQKVQETL